MSGVQGGSGRGLPSEAPPYPERRGTGGLGKDPPPLPHHPKEYHNYHFPFTKTLDKIWCPVEGCWGWVTIRTNLWVYFVHRHVQDTLVILEEGKRPHPQCNKYDMFVPWRSLNGLHNNTELYSMREGKKLIDPRRPSPPMKNPSRRYPPLIIYRG